MGYKTEAKRRVMRQEELKEFFKDKKVLITGHTGFKGAWLSQIMLNWEAEVCGYSLAPNTKPSLFEALRLAEKMDSNIADIRDLEELDKVVKKFKPDIIFHLAAQPIVRESYDNPVYTYEANVMGTVNVLETIRLNSIKAGVIITTDKVYRNFEKDIGYKEEDHLGGYDPYSNSKACADLVVSSYISSFFNEKDFGKKHNTLVASARAGNVVGGGDWAKDRLLPDAIKAFLVNNEDLLIRSPKAIRPWQHVLEPLYGYILLAVHLYNGEVDKAGGWNFGPQEDDMKEVEHVIGLVTKHLDKGRVVVQEDKSKHEAGILKLDNSKARDKLGWIPKYDLGQTIKETVKWYEVFHLGHEDITNYTVKQIETYFNTVKGEEKIEKRDRVASR
jgi:CDP-glucose 4,6-dehydratase